MLEKEFIEVYDKFKSNFYKNIFAGFSGREATLTATETFCVELIHVLSKPTVNKLASFLGISQPNAAYKVASLEKKGYVKKIQSKEDRRVYYLEVTNKFKKYYDIKNEYIYTVLGRVRERYTDEQVKKIEELLRVVNTELMPEVTNYQEEK